MQLRHSPLATAFSIIGVAGLIASAFLVANMGNSYVLLIFLVSNALAVLSVIGIRRVNLEEKKFERQLLELEMDAHKFDITSADIDDYSQAGDTAPFHPRIAAQESRSEKMGVMLSSLGFSRTHRFLRTIREGRAS